MFNFPRSVELFLKMAYCQIGIHCKLQKMACISWGLALMPSGQLHWFTPAGIQPHQCQWSYASLPPTSNLAHEGYSILQSSMKQFWRITRVKTGDKNMCNDRSQAILNSPFACHVKEQDNQAQEYCKGENDTSLREACQEFLQNPVVNVNHWQQTHF